MPACQGRGQDRIWTGTRGTSHPSHLPKPLYICTCCCNFYCPRQEGEDTVVYFLVAADDMPTPGMSSLPLTELLTTLFCAGDTDFALPGNALRETTLPTKMRKTQKAKRRKLRQWKSAAATCRLRFPAPQKLLLFAASEKTAAFPSAGAAPKRTCHPALYRRQARLKNALPAACKSGRRAATQPRRCLPPKLYRCCGITKNGRERRLPCREHGGARKTKTLPTRRH